jgi:hypothetical protein
LEPMSTTAIGSSSRLLSSRAYSRITRLTPPWAAPWQG